MGKAKGNIMLIPPSSVLAAGKNAQWIWDVISKASSRPELEQAIVDLNNDIFERDSYTTREDTMNTIHALLIERASCFGCEDLLSMMEMQVGKT